KPAASDGRAHITSRRGPMSTVPSPLAVTTAATSHQEVSGRAPMKRLLLGLSIASGVALVGVFALTQAKRGGALGADGSVNGPQGQAGSADGPWVQPMPKS